MELEDRVSALERELATLRSQLQRTEASRRTGWSRWLLASVGALLVLNVVLPQPVSTQAKPPAAPHAVTRFDVPVVFMDGQRQVAEISRGGLSLTNLAGTGGWIMGVTGTDKLLLQGSEGGEPVIKLETRGMTVLTKGGAAVLSLGRSESGSGEILLGNPKGAAVVEAGMMADGRGVVRAYPIGGVPPAVIPKVIMGGTPK